MTPARIPEIVVPKWWLGAIGTFLMAAIMGAITWGVNVHSDVTKIKENVAGNTQKIDRGDYVTRQEFRDYIQPKLDRLEGKIDDISDRLSILKEVK